jgi:DNA-binding transcriptional LysR family regulator
MILTEQGRIVLQHAVRVLAEVDNISLSVADKSKTLRGRVSIGMPPTVAEVLAVPLVTSIRKAHPGVICRIVSAYSLYLLDWIHHGKLDIAILYDPESIRSLKSERLIEEQLVVVGPRGSGLSPGSPVKFQQLRGRPLVLPSREHSLRQIVERAADACGFPLEVRIEADCYSTLKQFVLNDGGWTILPPAALQTEVADSRFLTAPLIDPVVKRMLELCVPADRPISRLASMVRKAVLKTTSSLVEHGWWPGCTPQG